MKLKGNTLLSLVEPLLQPTVDDSAVVKPCHLASGTANSPGTASPLQAHLATISPPAVYLGRKCRPHIVLLHQSRNVLQQVLVYPPFSIAHDIVRMDDKANQTVMGGDHLRLLLPNI